MGIQINGSTDTITASSGTVSTPSNLSSSGTSTFSGITTVTGTTLFAKQLNLSGISTFNDNIVLANGKGIDFSATANSSGTMTSELLSDYEEGTFTPTFTGTTTNPTIGYAEQAGRYVKIGKMCFVVIRIVTNSVSSGSGEVRISGLPFTPTNDTSFSGTLAPGFVYNWSTNPKVFFALNGSTQIVMYSNDATNSISQVSHLNTGSFANYTNISGCYPTS